MDLSRLIMAELFRENAILFPCGGGKFFKFLRQIRSFLRELAIYLSTHRRFENFCNILLLILFILIETH